MTSAQKQQVEAALSAYDRAMTPGGEAAVLDMIDTFEIMIGFHKKLSADQLDRLMDGWVDRFASVPAFALKAAAERVVDRATFFPKPAEVRAQLDRVLYPFIVRRSLLDDLARLPVEDQADAATATPIDRTIEIDQMNHSIGHRPNVRRSPSQHTPAQTRA